MNGKRKRRLRKQVSLGIIVLCILLIGILALFLTPVFNVRNVTVTGNKTVATEDIISGSGVITGENIFNISLRAVRDNVSAINGISSVKVRRRLPSVISISVKEGSAIVYIDNDGDYVGLSADGTVIEIIKGNSLSAEARPVEASDNNGSDEENAVDETSADEEEEEDADETDDETDESTAEDTEEADDAEDKPSSDIPVVTGMGKLSCKVGSKPKYSDEKKAENLSLLLDEFLSDEICRGFTSIDLSYYDNITLVYQDRLNVRLGAAEDLEYKLKCFKVILSEQLDEDASGTLDLERLTYSPKKK